LKVEVPLPSPWGLTVHTTLPYWQIAKYPFKYRFWESQQKCGPDPGFSKRAGRGCKYLYWGEGKHPLAWGFGLW